MKHRDDEALSDPPRTVRRVVERRVRRFRHVVVARWSAFRGTTCTTPEALDSPAARPVRSALRQRSRWHLVLGRMFATLEDWPRAQSHFDRSACLDPSNATTWIELGRACLRTGEFGPVMDDRLGLVLSSRGDPDSAERCFEEAIRLGSSSGAGWTDLATARQAQGDLDLAESAAREATATSPADSSAWLRLGLIVNAQAHREGGFRSERLEELHAALTAGAAAPVGGARVNARFHLLRSCTQFQVWDRAFELASAGPPRWPGEPPVTELEQIVESGCTAAGVDWWFVAAWRLQAAHRYAASDRARERMAHRQICDAGDVRESDIGTTIHAAKAMARLEQPGNALEYLQDLRRGSLLPRDALALDKLRADLQLRCGDPAPMRTWTERHGVAVQPEAEARFRALVEGRRVAVVGPGVGGARSGVGMDTHDVVIRTKFARGTPENTDRVVERTDISYYSDSSIMVLLDKVEDALASGSLGLVVVRPTTYRRRRPAILDTDRVRTMPNEDLAHFQASHFGIQRILYDLLRYRPAAITLFNVDFFSGERHYPEHYLFDRHTAYEPRALVPVLPMFGHDLGGDFRFTRTLFRAGLIDGDPEVRRLLQMTPDEYVDLLEARVVGAPRSYTPPP